MEFQTVDHLAFLQEGRTAVRKRSVLQVEETLAATIAGVPVQDTCQLRRLTKMTVQPSRL